MRAGWVLLMLGAVVVAASLAGCGDPRVAGIVNGKEIITSAPVVVDRPHLRDNVRKDDIVCGAEPPAKTATQKQINQSIQNKLAWGRECKSKAEVGWEIISNEP